MTEAAPFVWTRSARSPATVGAFLFALALLIVGFAKSAPAIVMILWALVALELGRVSLRRRSASLRLDGSNLTFEVDGKGQTIPLSRVSQVKLERWAEGQADWRIEVAGGRVVRLPEVIVPPTRDFAFALREHGIEVKGDV
jgi:hypothetical protein